MGNWNLQSISCQCRDTGIIYFTHLLDLPAFHFTQNELCLQSTYVCTPALRDIIGNYNVCWPWNWMEFYLVVQPSWSRVFAISLRGWLHVTSYVVQMDETPVSQVTENNSIFKLISRLFPRLWDAVLRPCFTDILFDSIARQECRILNEKLKNFNCSGLWGIKCQCFCIEYIKIDTTTHSIYQDLNLIFSLQTRSRSLP